MDKLHWHPWVYSEITLGTPDFEEKYSASKMIKIIDTPFQNKSHSMSCPEPKEWARHVTTVAHP